MVSLQQHYITYFGKYLKITKLYSEWLNETLCYYYRTEEGYPATEEGSLAPEEGSLSPEEGSLAPAEGSLAPEEGCLL
jgi:hypothetical protein